ncbi:hypothetical protein [Corynebacterium oculi]|uniref:Uncharacterized protein n=1 Tax=Corynebacterium oculi TaxID=1544416 RepID=A0A0Q1AD15_9CORY|nr:hypothetical protein [Corynebacterium oculi]KQB84536.1 hypothetical protein Cocul_01339 [Corynebacterium oculi]
MTTTAEPADTPQGVPAPEQATTSEYQPPATQEDLDRIIEACLARERAKCQGYDGRVQGQAPGV